MGHPGWSERLRGDELAGLMGPVIGGCYDVSERLGKVGFVQPYGFGGTSSQHFSLTREKAMGAWSCGSFGNDDACDWVYELEESDNLDFLESTVDAVLTIGEEYLEAPEATRAIAAAEVVARLQGNLGVRDSYSEAADNWVEKLKLTPPVTLAHKARQALDRIISEPSELLELWQESEEGEAWIAAVLNLKERIRA